MSARHSSTDYPEHLNPFKKRSGLRGSFRELKKTLTRTFRRKDDNRSAIETRHQIAVAPSTRHSDPDSVVLRQNGTPIFKEKEYKSEMYPRSRFSERVAMSRREQTTSECNSDKDETNPFEEEVDSSKVADDSITSNSSNVFTKRRRRKKRAPLPPNMLEGSNGLQVPYKSDWSINSYDTDCSSHYCSEVDLEHTENKENLREIAEISTEIIGFCKEVSGKDDEVEAKGAMPDLVVSIEGDIRGHSVDGDETGKSATETVLTDTHQGDESGTTEILQDATKTESQAQESNTDVESRTGIVQEGESTVLVEAPKQEANTGVGDAAEEIRSNGSTEVRYGVTGIVQGVESTGLVEAPKGAGTGEEIRSNGSTEVSNDATGIVQGSESTGLVEAPKGAGSGDAADKIRCNGSTEVRNDVTGIVQGGESIGLVDAPKEEASTGAAKEIISNVGTEVSSQQQSEIKILDKALQMIGDCKVAGEVDSIVDEEELLDICHDHTVDICIPEDTVLDDEVAEDQNNNNHEKREINYVESKTMYILGSKDDLDKEINFNERTSLYISGSRDELNEQSNPVPKIRKHKLSKAALLGSADELNATASN